MPRASQPLPTRQLTLFPPSCPGPDRISLPKEALDTAAHLMAQMLFLEGSRGQRCRRGNGGTRR